MKWMRTGTSVIAWPLRFHLRRSKSCEAHLPISSSNIRTKIRWQGCSAFIAPVLKTGKRGGLLQDNTGAEPVTRAIRQLDAWWSRKLLGAEDALLVQFTDGMRGEEVKAKLIANENVKSGEAVQHLEIKAKLMRKAAYEQDEQCLNEVECVHFCKCVIKLMLSALSRCHRVEWQRLKFQAKGFQCAARDPVHDCLFKNRKTGHFDVR